MSLSLAELRNAFKTNDKNNDSAGQNNYYPFWNMNIGDSATIRFLPDANSNNPLGFLVEKHMHTLTINGESKSVPCLKMYGEECPICKVSQAYYAKDDKVNGKKYWKKKQHIAQALILSDPLPKKEVEVDGEKIKMNAEGQVRFVSINYSLYKIIKAAFEQGELDEVPFAFNGGCDFIINKDQQGDYASYVTSKFARKSSDLDDDTVAVVEEKMIDLATLLPKNPGLAKVEAWLEADLSGGAVVEPSSEGVKDVVENDDTPVVAAKPVVETPSDEDAEMAADDILADIKRRKAAKAAAAE